MKQGEVYEVTINTVKHNSYGVKALIRIGKQLNKSSAWKNKHNKRFELEVLKMLNGYSWPYSTISINNLKKCKSTKLKAAGVLYGH